jgi:hypothetical protein
VELSPNYASGSTAEEPPRCAPGPGAGRPCRLESVLSTGRALTCLVAGASRPLLTVCRTRARAEQVSRLLSERLGERIPFYHHGLDGGEREEVGREYLGRRDAALVATPGGARELLRDDLRTLIHASPPPAAADYLREAGWAGRDGRGAERILLRAVPERAGEGAAAARTPRCSYCPAQPGGGCGPCAPSCGFGSACLRAARALPPGWMEIVAAVAANNRSLSLRELCLLLAGKGGFATVGKKLYMYTGYGYLCSWRAEDIAEAVTALLLDGVLRLPRRGAWRHRVALVHREAAWKIRFRNC